MQILSSSSMRRLAGFGIALALAGWSGMSWMSPSPAAPRPLAWPQIQLAPVASGLSSPVDIANAGDGSGRLFIVEQAGRIKILQNGSLLGAPFLDITNRVLSGGERGLLSVAFPPGYASKGYFYVYYTRHDGNNQVSRFHISSQNQADPNSEQTIIVFQHPTYANHNGGQLFFGPDGYLYIGTGDGGGGGDPQGNAQNPASLLGKLLRIGVEPRAPLPDHLLPRLYLPLVRQGGPVVTYSIPADNPFVGVPGYREEIWALGLRNPWRFSFDRQTGDLYIGDVGQNAYEEIDFQPASSPGGENYGWNIMEGLHCYNAATCDQTGLTKPVIDYPHTNNNCSVTGGFFYRGPAFPAMRGVYFFGDYCSGWIFGLQYDGVQWQDNMLLETTHKISSFGEDEAGELYLADLSGGIYQVQEQPAKTN